MTQRGEWNFVTKSVTPSQVWHQLWHQVLPLFASFSFPWTHATLFADRGIWQMNKSHWEDSSSSIVLLHNYTLQNSQRSQSVRALVWPFFYPSRPFPVCSTQNTSNARVHIVKIFYQKAITPPVYSELNSHLKTQSTAARKQRGCAFESVWQSV